MCLQYEGRRGGRYKELLMDGINLSQEEVLEFGAEVGVISSGGGRRGAEQTVDGGEQCSGVVLL